jgi:hypothetical protein
VAPGDLSRQELITLVERIMASDAATTEEEDDRLVRLFQDSVVHPGATDLIFYPDKYFDGEPTPEQVVDAALAYKPIQLGPG